MNPILDQMAAWLTGLGNLHPTVPIIPVRVQIAKESWEGVRYITRLNYTAGMDACTRGDKKPTDTYDSEKILLLGDRPRVNQKPSPRPSHVCYRHQDGTDWYLATYMESHRLTKENAKYHPFGLTFMVCPWTFTGTTVDGDYWRKPKQPWLPPVHDPYLRYPITITNL